MLHRMYSYGPDMDMNMIDRKRGAKAPSIWRQEWYGGKKSRLYRYIPGSKINNLLFENSLAYCRG